MIIKKWGFFTQTVFIFLIFFSFSSESRAVLPRDVWRGVCLAHSWERGGKLGYGSEAGFEALIHLKKQGVDYVSITPFGFMESLNSSEVIGTHNSSFRFIETDERVTQATAQAKRLGMRVMLKPHIWIKGGQTREKIAPEDADGRAAWDKWWNNHNEWIVYYAKLAAKLDIDSLVIGVELHSALKNRPDKFIELADAVRRVYKGHITYATNWDKIAPPEVWKAVDSIGVQLYPPLIKKGGRQTDTAMRENLNRHLMRWIEIANGFSKPFVITEFGFRSADGAAFYPYAWPDRKTDEEPDEELQARLYTIFFEEISKREEVKGMFLWKYFTNKGTDEEGPTGFSPRGKLAEKVIRKWYGGVGDGEERRFWKFLRLR